MRASLPDSNYRGALRVIGIAGILLALPLPGLAADTDDSNQAAPAAARSIGPIIESRKLEELPSLIHDVAPEYPYANRVKNTEGQVLVDFVVGPDGSVIDPHAAKDSDPKFAAAAIAAVRQWKYRPARYQGQPVATRVQVPIVFQLREPELTGIEIAGPRLVVEVSTGTRVAVFDVLPEGSGADLVMAGRVLVAHAEDDTGKTLAAEANPSFFVYTAGETNGDGSDMLSSRDRIALLLRGLAAKATTVKSVEATLEMYVPYFDPNAVAAIENISTIYGVPVENPALAKAEVTLRVYDQKTAVNMAAAHTSGGPQEFDGGDLFGAHGAKRANAAAPTEQVRRAKNMRAMGRTQIAVAVSDPKQRMLMMEFQAADGSPLRYNHNGCYHSAVSAEKCFHVYDLGESRPEATRLVCYLLTEESVVSMPLQFSDEHSAESAKR